MSEHGHLVNQLANREAIEEIVQKHDLLRIQLDLSTAYASNLSAPSTVAKVEALEHAKI